MRFTIGVVCVVVVLLSLAEVSEANYKNAPMNGIMFGKRGPTGKFGKSVILLNRNSRFLNNTLGVSNYKIVFERIPQV